jgi:hypothetical protein
VESSKAMNCCPGIIAAYSYAELYSMCCTQHPCVIATRADISGITDTSHAADMRHSATNTHIGRISGVGHWCVLCIGMANGHEPHRTTHEKEIL